MYSEPFNLFLSLRLLQILNQFKTLEADLVDMQRYAAWKAADIRKALREGRTPTPGAPGDDLSANSAVSGEQTVTWHMCSLFP